MAPSWNMFHSRLDSEGLNSQHVNLKVKHVRIRHYTCSVEFFFMRVLRSVNQTINSIKTIHDITKVSEWAPELIDQFTPTNAQVYFKMKLTPVQYAALVLLIPVNYAPSEMYDACKNTFPIISQLDTKIQTGLMMRFAKSAFLSKRDDECLEILQAAMF